MLKVFVAQNPVDAHLLLGVLEAQGIPGEVRGEALFTTMRGGASASGLLPSVWIYEPAQEAQARDVIGRHQAGDSPAAGPLWLCPGCGEQHEPQFTQCWKCGAERV